MVDQVESIINLPPLAIKGLKISNNAATPDEKIDISAGMCRDSANNTDMVLGAAFPNAENKTFAAPLTLDITVSGKNGLDNGTVAANTMYAVYLISDSRGYGTTSGLFTLATNASPKMPFGYDSWRLIGFVNTDGTSDIFKGHMSGDGNWREWRYDAAISAGTSLTSATYAAVSMPTSVPPQENALVRMQFDWTANAAADTFNLRQFGATGDQFGLIATVAGATAHMYNNTVLPVSLDAGAPKIQYKISAGSLDLAVLGFAFGV